MDEIERQLEQGLKHHLAGRFHEAEVTYRRVLGIAPERPRAWYLLGMIAYEARQDAAAAELIGQAIARQPDHAEFYNGLSIVLQRQGQNDAAIECLKRGLRYQPQSVALHNNLAEAYKAKGDIQNALASYQRALDIEDDFLVTRSNRLMVLHYDPDIARADLFAEHHRWAEIQRRTIAPQTEHPNRPDPTRKIRVGYVSPDFREHAVARFLEPILRHYDRQRLDVLLYDSHPLEDATSRVFRGLVTGWRCIEGLSTEAAVDVIRRDAIDILVDLAGHTAHHRLDVFAAKPAPIQVTYLGYPNTTGLDTIDYRLSDDVLDPPDESSWSTEKVLRLPGGFCSFEPPSHAPPVSPVPALTRPGITFGSHHGIPKLNDQVFRLWLEILSAVPDSRILLIRSSFKPPVVEDLRRRMAAIGFGPHQIAFCRPIETETSYLAPQAEVDISLDCFPYTGHTTTCEALWMGVPVVTLRGDRPSGRASASVLTSLGLERWIADTPSDYLRIAIELAADLQQRIAWRRALRDRMRGTLCDGPAFCRKLEAAFGEMWQAWCDRAASREKRPAT